MTSTTHSPRSRGTFRAVDVAQKEAQDTMPRRKHPDGVVRDTGDVVGGVCNGDVLRFSYGSDMLGKSPTPLEMRVALCDGESRAGTTSTVSKHAHPTYTVSNHLTSADSMTI